MRPGLEDSGASTKGRRPPRVARGGLHRPTLLPGVTVGGWQEWDPAPHRLNAGVADSWPGGGG